ncbi:hypothetical protein V1477_007110 [Vespula maculifrons]|uniref:Uncharacterized protein n=1 Tax=Vespula maculifrons TaxID=7453 RepID=A0ABD2CHK5_VESMC
MLALARGLRLCSTCINTVPRPVIHADEPQNSWGQGAKERVKRLLVRMTKGGWKKNERKKTEEKNRKRKKEREEKRNVVEAAAPAAPAAAAAAAAAEAASRKG